MRIHATINERTLRRTFKEQKPGRHGLTVVDRNLPQFGFTVAKDGRKTFFVRAARPVGVPKTLLGTADGITAAEAREKAIAARDDAGSRLRGKAIAACRYLLPFFRAMRVAEIDRADVRRWFDSMSATPGNANRTLPVLSVMMRQAELWNLRPQGSNPCRNMRRYKMVPRERFLSRDELKRLGFVLDHAEDTQAASAIRLLLFTGARFSEITGLRWDWIRDARAVLPDSKDRAEGDTDPTARAGRPERTAAHRPIRLPEPQG